MKIETFLDSYGARNMCIAHDYCTCMDKDKKRPPAQTDGRKSAAENRKDKSCHGQTLG